MKRDNGRSGETLPPGVTEVELLAACVGPDLDSITAQSALKGLRDNCLYLHHDGARYVFKTTPNVTKLIEDEAQNVRPDEVRDLIKSEIDKRIKSPRSAIVWPASSDRIPDSEPTFQIAYLPLDFAELDPDQQEPVPAITLRAAVTGRGSIATVSAWPFPAATSSSRCAAPPATSRRSVGSSRRSARLA